MYEGGRALIGSVVSIDDEMLVELVWTKRPRPDEGEQAVTWLIGPSSPAGMITLDRWRDIGCPVDVTIGPRGAVLQSPQARASLRTLPTTD
jgi:hypothetical protein